VRVPEGSIALNFGSNLISGAGWKAVYHSAVDEGGCDRLMFATFAGDFNPFPTDSTPGPADAVEPGAKFLSAVTYSQALSYASSRGLTYPFKSSVFRGAMDLSEGIEASAPLLTVGIATAHSLGATIVAAAGGSCH
jgi:hypothetical protein